MGPGDEVTFTHNQNVEWLLTDKKPVLLIRDSVEEID